MTKKDHHHHQHESQTEMFHSLSLLMRPMKTSLIQLIQLVGVKNDACFQYKFEFIS